MKVFFSFCIFLLSFSSIAQPGDPNGGVKPGGSPVPFSGLELLLGAGALLGAKRILSLRNKDQKH